MTASPKLLGLAALAAVADHLGVHHAILTTRALEHERASSPSRASRAPGLVAAATLEALRDRLAPDRRGAA